MTAALTYDVKRHVTLPCDVSELTDRRTDRHTDRQTDGLTHRQTDRRTDRQTSRVTLPYDVSELKVTAECDVVVVV